MRAVMLGLAASAAAIALGAAPAAAAERWSDPDFMAAANVVVHRSSEGVVGGPAHGDDRDRRRDRRHRRDRDIDVAYVGGLYGGEWSLYNNRSFEPSSYNDWWHDRPDRAFPRWMQSNQGCERQYWTGAGWRC